MSPEQAQGLLEIDHRSDIYSLGTLGYRILVGQAPFIGWDANDVLSKHVKEAPVPIRDINTTIPKEFADAEMRCLEMDPWQRFSTAKELSSALEAKADVGRHFKHCGTYYAQHRTSPYSEDLMRRRSLLLHLLTAVFLAGGLVSHVSAQTPQLRPVSVGSPMADFTLPILQGGDFTLSDYHGKRLMLVFPRGLSGPTSWCHVCPYQHAELMEYDAETGFRANSNLEILFVLPYASEKVDEWVNAFPTLLQDIEDWKNPEDTAALDDRGRARMERVRQIFPNTFQVEPEDVRNSFPILVDADRAVTSGLGIFTTDWSGSEADQNIPTILIVDENGVLLFKYMSQNTMDRPPLEYLVQFMEVLSELGS